MGVVDRLLPFSILAYLAKCTVMYVSKRSGFTNPLFDIPVPAPEAQLFNNHLHDLLAEKTCMKYGGMRFPRVCRSQITVTFLELDDVMESAFKLLPHTFFSGECLVAKPDLSTLKIFSCAEK